MGGSPGILDVGWEIRGGAHSDRLCQDVVTILTDGSAFPAWLDGVAFVSRGTAVGDDTVTPQSGHPVSYP